MHINAYTDKYIIEHILFMKEKPHSFWIQKAIALAKQGQTPFGALLVNTKDEFITAYNTTKLNGPTAHAEMNVIRQMHLLDYTETKTLRLYTSVEPCPMCMSAIVWAGIGSVIYGASIDDAAKYGKQIHVNSSEIVSKSWLSIQIIHHIERSLCLELFE